MNFLFLHMDFFYIVQTFFITVYLNHGSEISPFLLQSYSIRAAKDLCSVDILYFH